MNEGSSCKDAREQSGVERTKAESMKVNRKESLKGGGGCTVRLAKPDLRS
jgi:hypothetical protein